MKPYVAGSFGNARLFANGYVARPSAVVSEVPSARQLCAALVAKSGSKLLSGSPPFITCLTYRSYEAVRPPISRRFVQCRRAFRAVAHERFLRQLRRSDRMLRGLWFALLPGWVEGPSAVGR